MATQAAQVPESDPAFAATFARHCADLLYVEQMIPTRGDVTHIFRLGRKVIGGVVFRHDRICAIWNLADTDPSLPPEVELEYGAPDLHWSHFGGEGTGACASHPMPWTPGQWYGLAVRRWYVPWEDVTHAAIFIYSHAHSTWMHCLTATVPGANLKLCGTTCTHVLERSQRGASDVCCRHFRMLSGQGWEKPLDQSEAKPEPANANAMVTHVTAMPSQGELTVRWTLLASAPPQLGARIWIEDEDRRVCATERVRVPHVHEVTMDISGLRGHCHVHVVVEDIFDQDSNDGYAGFVC